MNDRDSNTRAFKLDKHLSQRAARERRRKTQRIILIVLMSLLAVSLIVTTVVICSELAGGGEDTLPYVDQTTSAPGPDGDTNVVPAESTSPDETSTPETTAGTSEGYTVKLMTEEDIHRGELILVNDNYKYQPPATTSDLCDVRSSRSEKWGISATGKTIHSYSCAYDLKLSAKALTALNDMIDDFYDATGNQDVYFPQLSCYRSSTEQAELYDLKPSREDPDGCSEHNTGLAVDVRAWLTLESGDIYPYISEDYSSCVQIYNWLNSNCYKYGFVQRYTDGKASVTHSAHYSEHYRYVGYPHALAMMRNDLCLEEYLAVLAARHSYDSTHYIINGDDGVTYEIYYVPAATGEGATTSVPVPINLPYTISGNNYDGFIVTVTRA